MLVCRAVGQACSIESLMQSCLKETIAPTLQSIEEKLKNLENTSSSLSNVVSHTEELRINSPMTLSAHQSRPHLSNTLNSTSEVLASFINEEKERGRRKLNVIVHNVAESSAESGAGRKSHDISNVTSIFDKYVEVKVRVANANRIG